ncbi:hypothetical protein EMIT0111MI5_60125 [Burkholderia sp. IT-111MI5]
MLRRLVLAGLVRNGPASDVSRSVDAEVTGRQRLPMPDAAAGRGEPVRGRDERIGRRAVPGVAAAALGHGTRARRRGAANRPAGHAAAYASPCVSFRCLRCL